MNQGNFTKGEWYQLEDNLGCKNIMARQRGVPEDESGLFTVSEIGYTHGRADEAEDEANARLICAAPKLLRACQTLIHEFHPDWPAAGSRGRENQQWTPQQLVVLDEAVEIIGEALGEQEPDND